MKLGPEIRFRIRPTESDLVPLIGKPCRLLLVSGDIVAIGILRGYMWAHPEPGEIANWRNYTQGQGWPFIMFDGFRVPTSATYAGEDILQALLEDEE